MIILLDFVVILALILICVRSVLEENTTLTLFILSMENYGLVMNVMLPILTIDIVVGFVETMMSVGAA